MFKMNGSKVKYDKKPFSYAKHVNDVNSLNEYFSVFNPLTQVHKLQPSGQIWPARWAHFSMFFI